MKRLFTITVLAGLLLPAFHLPAQGRVSFEKEIVPLLAKRCLECHNVRDEKGGLDLSTELVRRGGRINLFGWLKGQVATFNPTAWHGKGISIVNSSPSANLRDPFPPAIRLIQNGVIDLRKLVTHVVPIDEYPAFMAGVTGGTVDGYIKGVVTTG